MVDSIVGGRGQLVSAQELRGLLARSDAADVVVLEVGTRRDDGDARDDFVAGHVPGAFYVQFEEELVGVATGTNGAAPLPAADELQERIRSWGIDEDTLVVLYNRGRPGPAARTWFVLGWAGLAQVRLLDGGWDAWLAAGGDVDTSPTAPGRRGGFTVTPGALPVLTAEQAAEVARRGVLLDARAASQYHGDPGRDPRRPSGHIPGAVSAPHADLLNPDGTLRDAAGLEEHFASLGVDLGGEIGVYCGAGVGASYEVFALWTLGVPAALYVGSWSEWISDPSRPIEQSVPV